MNSDQLTDQLRDVLKAAGLEIRGECHPNSLRVEFTTSPPLTWSFGQCDQATENIYNANVCGSRLGNVFSTDHDRAHGFWQFRLESYDLDPNLPPHAGRSLSTPSA